MRERIWWPNAQKRRCGCGCECTPNLVASIEPDMFRSATKPTNRQNPNAWRLSSQLCFFRLPLNVNRIPVKSVVVSGGWSLKGLNRRTALRPSAHHHTLYASLILGVGDRNRNTKNEHLLLIFVPAKAPRQQSCDSMNCRQHLLGISRMCSANK